jgi:hypothetical protein
MPKGLRCNFSAFSKQNGFRTSEEPWSMRVTSYWRVPTVYLLEAPILIITWAPMLLEGSSGPTWAPGELGKDEGVPWLQRFKICLPWHGKAPGIFRFFQTLLQGLAFVSLVGIVIPSGWCLKFVTSTHIIVKPSPITYVGSISSHKFSPFSTLSPFGAGWDTIFHGFPVFDG